jgi:hypothetical protein
MSYANVVICIGPLPFLETWPPIYRGQERTVRDRLKASQVDHHVHFRYAPCLTDFTFKFIRRPTSPILSPSSRIFVELTLVNRSLTLQHTAESIVTLSLHLHHVPQADMLECRLEILLIVPLRIKILHVWICSPKGVSITTYWQMTHIWWHLWKELYCMTFGWWISNANLHKANFILQSLQNFLSKF